VLSRKARQARAKLILICLCGVLWLISNKTPPRAQFYQDPIRWQAEYKKPARIEARHVTSRSYERIPLGDFEITAYTAGYESCGKLPSDPAYGITASGERVKENHTIATDWSVLPKGTKVMIEGFPYTFVVEDRGGAIKGNRIDIYMESLDDALSFGRQNKKVWVIK
jgi:3D (Asp-Asp-Asp) domain-containing protein